MEDKKYKDPFISEDPIDDIPKDFLYQENNENLFGDDTNDTNDTNDINNISNDEDLFKKYGIEENEIKEQYEKQKKYQLNAERLKKYSERTSALLTNAITKQAPELLKNWLKFDKNKIYLKAIDGEVDLSKKFAIDDETELTADALLDYHNKTVDEVMNVDEDLQNEIQLTIQELYEESGDALPPNKRLMVLGAFLLIDIGSKTILLNKYKSDILDMIKVSEEERNRKKVMDKDNEKTKEEETENEEEDDEYDDSEYDDDDDGGNGGGNNGGGNNGGGNEGIYYEREKDDRDIEIERLMKENEMLRNSFKDLKNEIESIKKGGDNKENIKNKPFGDFTDTSDIIKDAEIINFEPSEEKFKKRKKTNKIKIDKKNIDYSKLKKDDNDDDSDSITLDDIAEV